MPFLSTLVAPSTAPPIERRGSRALPECANPNCASGWLHLWRKRRVPVVEGGWLCSPNCTRARIEELICRELAQSKPASQHRHRIPIGLTLLAQGWITHDQLRQALKSQRQENGQMRLGELLMERHGLDETRLTQALGIQWNCPIFRLEKHVDVLPVTAIPRLLSESFGFVPLRLTSSGTLYLAFEDRIDHSIALAIERVTRLRVESGLLSGSEFRRAQEHVVQGQFPRARLIEAGSVALLADSLAKHIEKSRPVESRLVRLRDLFWLRLWNHPEGSTTVQPGEVEDIIGSVVHFG